MIFMIGARWYIGVPFASYAADPGSNLGEGKTNLSFVLVLRSGYGGVGWETIAERLSRLIGTSHRHVDICHCRNSPIESRIIHKSRIGPGLGQKATSGSSWLKRKDYNRYTYTYTYTLIITMSTYIKYGIY